MLDEEVGVPVVKEQEPTFSQGPIVHMHHSGAPFCLLDLLRRAGGLFDAVQDLGKGSVSYSAMESVNLAAVDVALYADFELLLLQRRDCVQGAYLATIFKTLLDLDTVHIPHGLYADPQQMTHRCHVEDAPPDDALPEGTREILLHLQEVSVVSLELLHADFLVAWAPK